MREQLKEMELELLQYHKSNATLDLMIGELRLKRDGMATEVASLRAELARRDETLLEVGRDVKAVHMCVHDAKALRSSMTHLYRKFIYEDRASLALSMTSGGGASGAGKDGGEPKESLAKALSARGLSALPPGVNLEDLQTELTHQRQHLERGVDGMRRRMEKEAQAAASDRARLLRENAALTQEINDLRRDTRYLHAELASTLAADRSAAAATRAGAGAAPSPSSSAAAPHAAVTAALAPTPAPASAAAAAATGGAGLPLGSTGGRRTTAALGVTLGAKLSRAAPAHGRR